MAKKRKEVKIMVDAEILNALSSTVGILFQIIKSKRLTDDELNAIRKATKLMERCNEMMDKQYPFTEN